MNRTTLAFALAAIWAVGLTLSIVFHSSDPGARGVVADISFFAWLITSVALLVLGAAALVRRMQSSSQTVRE